MAGIHRGVRNRAQVWRDVLWTPFAKVAVALYGFVAFVQWLYALLGELLPPDTMESVQQWTAPVRGALRQWPLETWAIVVLGTLALVLLEGSFRAVTAARTGAATELAGLRARIAEFKEQRPSIEVKLRQEESPVAIGNLLFLEVTNLGAPADFTAEIEVAAGAYLARAPGHHFARWSHSRDYRIRIPKWGKALLQAGARERPFSELDSHEFAWWLYGLTEDNEDMSGWLAEWRYGGPAAQEPMVVRFTIFAEPAFVDGPLTVKVRYDGPDPTLIQSPDEE